MNADKLCSDLSVYHLEEDMMYIKQKNDVFTYTAHLYVNGNIVVVIIHLPNAATINNIKKHLFSKMSLIYFLKKKW